LHCTTTPWFGTHPLSTHVPAASAHEPRVAQRGTQAPSTQTRSLLAQSFVSAQGLLATLHTPSARRHAKPAGHWGSVVQPDVHLPSTQSFELGHCVSSLQSSVNATQSPSTQRSVVEHWRSAPQA